MQENANPSEPSRGEIDALAEPALIEFGTAWCGHCQAAQPLIAAALAGHPQLRVAAARQRHPRLVREKRGDAWRFREGRRQIMRRWV